MLMSLKRKVPDDLVGEALRKKLAFLKKKKKGIRIPVPDDKSDPTRTWPWLLEICLAQERAGPTAASKSENPLRLAESRGDYDFEALQVEEIEKSCHHCAFVGPIEAAPLPAPKNRGVLSNRDIYKGELLCSSVPSIVVRNLADEQDSNAELFSDLSRAEMTAKLISMADADKVILDTLRTFEFAGKEDVINDTRALCTAIISKYTWAIDYSSKEPKGKKYYGHYTKVAGHAFTIDGFAGKFNHSCVPNATMVTYGALQFFRANCSIPKDTEICVSYGYDPLDSVQQRIEKLRIHADFECTCPLCVFQLQHEPPAHVTGISTPPDIDYGNFLLDFLQRGDYQDLLERLVLVTSTASDQSRLVKDAVKWCAMIEDRDPSDPSRCFRNASFTVLDLLSRYPMLKHHAEQCTIKGQMDLASPVWKRLFVQATLLSLMLLTMTWPKPNDIGIPFGDLIRPEMNHLADLLEACDTDLRLLYGFDEHWAHAADPTFWRQKCLEYTDCF